MQRRHMLLPALVGLLALCAIAPLAHATPPSSEVPLPTQAAHTSSQDREGAARAIIREGERANDVTDPAGALALFEKAIEQYPDTEVVRFAYVRKAETLVYLDRCDEAIQLGRWVIEKYPKTKPACWAQFWVGQALLKKGERLAGMTALRGVNGLLPDRNDLTPLDLSRWVLGELCEPQYLLHKDIGDVMSFLGMGRDDAQSRAEVYAILAAYRGRDGRIDRGNSFIGRLERECADQKVEQDWAKAKVAASYLDKAGTDGEFVNLAIGMLQPILTNNNDDAAAQGCLSLARFYRRGNLSAKAEEVLRAGKERFLATSHGAEILYELATLLTKQGRDTEAKLVLEELLREKGDSKYAAPARLLMAQGAGVKPTRSLAELIQEAAKDFDPQWMHLASSPKGGELGDPVIVARQIVALSKDRDAYIEIAFGLVDKLAAREGYSKEDVEKAKAQVAYCFLETARARREFWPDTISCAQFMADRCRESGDCRGARRLYEAVLGLTGVSAEMRAMSEYGLALCFMDEHRDDAAKRAMLRVLERYPDTQAAKKVRGRLWAGGGQQTE